MEATAAKYVGAKLLGEVQEESLEDLLKTIRTQLLADTSRPTQNNPPSTSLHTTTSTTMHSHQPILTPQPHIPFPALRSLISRYQKATLSSPPPVLNISGRYLPLIYHLVSTLIATKPHDTNSHEQAQQGRQEFSEQDQQHPGYTVVIIDAECRFDVTRLVGDPWPHPTPNSHKPNQADTDHQTHVTHPKSFTTKPTRNISSNSANTNSDAQENDTNPYPATPADLRHVYIFRPSHSQVRATLSAAGEYMLYGNHQSREREWWGTIIVGGSGLSIHTSEDNNSNVARRGGGTGPGNVPPAADILCTYRGWLKVEREQVPGFHIGISAQEAVADRGRRWEVVERSGWRAGSRWGSYEFGRARGSL